MMARRRPCEFQWSQSAILKNLRSAGPLSALYVAVLLAYLSLRSCVGVFSHFQGECRLLRACRACIQVDHIGQNPVPRDNPSHRNSTMRPLAIITTLACICLLACADRGIAET